MLLKKRYEAAAIGSAEFDHKVPHKSNLDDSLLEALLEASRAGILPKSATLNGPSVVSFPV